LTFKVGQLFGKNYIFSCFKDLLGFFVVVCLLLLVGPLYVLPISTCFRSCHPWRHAKLW